MVSHKSHATRHNARQKTRLQRTATPTTHHAAQTYRFSQRRCSKLCVHKPCVCANTQFLTNHAHLHIPETTVSNDQRHRAFSLSPTHRNCAANTTYIALYINITHYARIPSANKHLCRASTRCPNCASDTRTNRTPNTHTNDYHEGTHNTP